MFAISAYAFAQGFMMIPQVVSVQLLKHEISPIVSALTLSASSFFATLTIPILYWFIPFYGLEKSILLANIVFSIAMLCLGIS